MKKIKCVSYCFRLFFQFIFLFFIIIHIYGWIYAPQGMNFFNVLPAVYQPFIFVDLDFNTKLAGFSITTIPLTIKLFLIAYLIKLFRLYEQEIFFAKKNVAYIRNIGVSLLMLQLVKPISDFILGFVLTAFNPPGFRFASISISDTNIGLIITGLIIILTSWITSVGCKLHEEQQLII